jgi:hypothetical protein
VDEQRDQANRKVKAAIVQLKFLGQRYVDVFTRRSQDQQKLRQRTGRFQSLHVKGEHVKWPWTPFARGGGVNVLKGDFGRAIALVKKIKEVQAAHPMPVIMNKLQARTIGDLLRAKLNASHGLA